MYIAAITYSSMTISSMSYFVSL